MDIKVKRSLEFFLSAADLQQKANHLVEILSRLSILAGANGLEAGKAESAWFIQLRKEARRRGHEAELEYIFDDIRDYWYSTDLERRGAQASSGASTSEVSCLSSGANLHSPFTPPVGQKDPAR